VSASECRSGFKACFGVVSLHVGRLRSTVNGMGSALDVIGDALDDDPLPGHASILNIPEPRTDRILAEWMATVLRDQSRPA
jgi:hypothetical protein